MILTAKAFFQRIAVHELVIPIPSTDIPHIIYIYIYALFDINKKIDREVSLSTKKQGSLFTEGQLLASYA